MTPPLVAQALDHVRSVYPDVTQVVFTVEHKWVFMTDDRDAPAFDERIDVNILNDAADSLSSVPAFFSIYDATDPKAIAKRIGEDIQSLRSVIDEPVEIPVSDTLSVEVRPASDGDYLSALHREHGWAVVNYATEGLIVDVFNADQSSLDSIYSLAIPEDELVASEA